MNRITTHFICLMATALCMVTPAMADEHENEGVARIVKMTPRDGQEAALLEAIEKYHKYVAQFEGSFRYQWYEVLAGPNAGSFYARTGDHNWADFDARYDWQEEAGEMFDKTVAPLIESAEIRMTVERKDNQHWPENMEGYSLFFVESWYVKNGMHGKFNQGLKKIVDILKANDFQGHFGFYNVAVGGRGGEVGFVSPHKSWAGMSEKSPSFSEIMIRELGGEEAFGAFMSDFGTTFVFGESMMLRYMPRASDYGD